MLSSRVSPLDSARAFALGVVASAGSCGEEEEEEEAALTGADCDGAEMDFLLHTSQPFTGVHIAHTQKARRWTSCVQVAAA